MDSLFFNITDRSYKVTDIYREGKEHITRVDISNGILFIDIFLDSHREKIFDIKNLDRMMVISVIKQGSFSIKTDKGEKTHIFKEDSIDIFLSSRQKFRLAIDKDQSEIFVLFIADFILKRYIGSDQNDLISFLYNQLQTDISLRHLNSQSIDAMSLYIIDKITKTKSSDPLNSIICEHNILEFMIHRFKLLDIDNEELSNDELCISKSAKDILLHSFISPPTISTLAHLCATNETKLKAVFKKRYKTTIHSYIQKLRLEKANLLLRDQLLNIGEISRDVGYKHQGHFSKLFFEYYGIYPKELLKR